MEPTREQAEAMATVRHALQHGREAVLSGPAGTGKSTVMRWLIDMLLADGWGVGLAAPTGRAGVRLRDVTGHPAATLHSLVYRRVDEDSGELVFGRPGPPCDPDTVLIVDESSMVDAKIYGHAMAHLPHTSRALWVGDHEQLEPVQGPWGPDLTEPTAKLTEIHRQALDSPIIGYATAIRRGLARTWRREHGLEVLPTTWDDEAALSLCRGGVSHAVDWASARYQVEADATVVTFTHRVREAINAGVRRSLGFTEDLEPGDRLLIKMNSYELGVMNGEVVNVTNVERVRHFGHECFKIWAQEIAGPVFLLVDHLNTRTRDPWDLRRSMGTERWGQARLIWAWHGQCITVHSAQGSQWDEVAFVAGRAVARKAMSREEGSADFARRLCYTAVTRAARRLVVIDNT